MKVWHLVLINLVFYLLLFGCHVFMLNFLTSYIPSPPSNNAKYAHFDYPIIRIEWTWPGSIDKIAGGISIPDLWYIILLILAIVVNVISVKLIKETTRTA